MCDANHNTIIQYYNIIYNIQWRDTYYTNLLWYGPQNSGVLVIWIFLSNDRHYKKTLCIIPAFVYYDEKPNSNYKSTIYIYIYIYWDKSSRVYAAVYIILYMFIERCIIIWIIPLSRHMILTQYYYYYHNIIFLVHCKHLRHA